MELIVSSSRTVTGGQRIIHMYYYLNNVNEQRTPDLWVAHKPCQEPLGC